MDGTDTTSSRRVHMQHVVVIVAGAPIGERETRDLGCSAHTQTYGSGGSADELTHLFDGQRIDRLIIDGQEHVARENIAREL